MKSLWQDQEAADCVAHYAKQGITEDVALRVYTSRLLGREPALVLHGGGNTSVKTRMRDLSGEEIEVICVKGSGWDMAHIEPAGVPAVRLAPLLGLQALEQLSDEDMVNAQRGNLLDSQAPNPSVEALLHAFIPHKFIDHTHANAVLAVSDQANGMALCREIFGPTMAVLDYVMPGFALAKAVANVYASAPQIEGVILHKHGIFTFGETAQQAYERMIAMVSRAEDYIAGKKAQAAQAMQAAQAAATQEAATQEAATQEAATQGAAMQDKLAQLAQLAPMVRGALAQPQGQGRYVRMVAELRCDGVIGQFCARPDLAAAAWTGVITPDHTIRIKNRPLVLPAPSSVPSSAPGTDLAEFKQQLQTRLAAYVEHYHHYFQTNDALLPGQRRELDPMPRLVLVQGLGLIAFGKSKKDAQIHADLAQATMQTILDAEAVGCFEPLAEADLFTMEYWSLEQAKLGQGKEAPLARQVALITGGAGAIGLACAKLFAAQGAEVVLLDQQAEAVAQAARAVGGKALGLVCDVTDAQAVRAAFDAACQRFGGVDIVLSNAGAAWEGPIATLDDATLRKSFELNFFAHQYVAQNAVRVMRSQGTGGVLLFNVSKQAVNPGANFGSYGTAKAAALLLSRQYALEHGVDGIRSNAVNADRIRSGLLTGEMIASRSRARGLDETEYMSGNLLGQEVLAQDVAEAFLALALAHKTTGHVMTVDGGNIAAALR
jgi:rhamnose utilization protein RhaD (predicted bifunctional aldolase and dehydrogenase)/NAD(P)-dependent dehydrogenase (short-subunit alcohol dehydrogenase family)